MQRGIAMAAEPRFDTINGVSLKVLAETIDAIKKDPGLGRCKFRARNKWMGGTKNGTTVTGFYGARAEQKHALAFHMLADEPPILSGGDEAANPVEHLLHALASCVTTSLVAHAAVRGIHIEELESELEGDIDLRGFLGLANDVPKGYTNIRMKFRVKTDAENLKLLRRLSEFSPVYNTLSHGVNVDVEIGPK